MNATEQLERISGKIEELAKERDMYKESYQKTAVAIALLAGACKSRRDVFKGDHDEVAINEVIDYGLDLLLALCTKGLA